MPGAGIRAGRSGAPFMLYRAGERSRPADPGRLRAVRAGKSGSRLAPRGSILPERRAPRWSGRRSILYRAGLVTRLRGAGRGDKRGGRVRGRLRDRPVQCGRFETATAPIRPNSPRPPPPRKRPDNGHPAPPRLGAGRGDLRAVWPFPGRVGAEPGRRWSIPSLPGARRPASPGPCPGSRLPRRSERSPCWRSSTGADSARAGYTSGAEGPSCALAGRNGSGGGGAKWG